MAGKNGKTKLTIVVKIDRVKEARRSSRNKFGTPGAGRKTKFVDRKKQSNKTSCRRDGKNKGKYEDGD